MEWHIVKRHSLVRYRTVLASIAVLLASPAIAHPGHGENFGFMGGLIHPFTGLDHLAAMLMSGIWAAQLQIKARWLGPASFVAAMIGGFVIARMGTAFAPEFVITISLIGFPVLIATARRAPLVPQFGCVTIFAFAHGFAHGRECGLAFPAFAVGMTIATVLLHSTGLAIASHLSAPTVLYRGRLSSIPSTRTSDFRQEVDAAR